MNLPVGANHRIKSDQYGWIVQERESRTRKGNIVDEWKSLAWHRTFDGAVRSLGERMIRAAEAENFQEAIRAVQGVCKSLSDSLPTEIEVRAHAGIDKSLKARGPKSAARVGDLSGRKLGEPE